jgi:signal transduction histidine kinase
MMVMLDERGRLIEFNPAAEEMLGPLSSYLGQDFRCWLRNVGPAQLLALTGLTLPKLRQCVRDVIQQPLDITRRLFQYTAREQTLSICETRSPVLDAQGQLIGWLLVWRDYTDEYRLDVLRQEFHTMVVHDLRNPITSVISGLSMLRDLLAETPVDINALGEVVHIAENSAENMLNLVQTLLDISRLEKNMDTMDCESRPLGDTLHHATTAVLGLAMGADIAVNVRVPPDLPPVWMDDEKIHRVLVNLLDNALRYTPRHGEVQIDVNYEAGDNAVTVRIEDSGPGVPPEARNRVFEKFVQLDAQRVLRGHKGTGLGLTFCKLVIDAHQGHIWVEDSTAGGAAFCFTLPIVGARGMIQGDIV